MSNRHAILTPLRAVQAILLLALAAPAVAQPLPEPSRAPPEVMGDRPSSRPADERPGNREANPARLQPEPPNSAARGAPAATQNNLNEAQARASMERAGYTQISELRLEAGGVWHAIGQRNGRAARLRLDATGDLRTE